MIESISTALGRSYHALKLTSVSARSSGLQRAEYGYRDVIGYPRTGNSQGVYSFTHYLYDPEHYPMVRSNGFYAL